MRLLIIRHGKAEERPKPLFSKKGDSGRRLTDDGRKDMRKIAKGLRELAPAIDMLAASPLIRAHETAEIVAKVFSIRDIIEQPLLAPDADKHALIGWLGDQPANATVAVVGHEPHLSSFASRLIGGSERSSLLLKKGACCLIEFERAIAVGGGVLSWLLQPGQLRKIDA